MHENREISWTSWSKDQDRSAKAKKPNGGRARSGEVGLRHSTDEPAEQRGLVFRGGWGGKGVDPGEKSFDLTRSRHSAGVRVSHGLRDVRRVTFAATIQGKRRMR